MKNKKRGIPLNKFPVVKEAKIRDRRNNAPPNMILTEREFATIVSIGYLSFAIKYKFALPIPRFPNETTKLGITIKISSAPRLVGPKIRVTIMPLMRDRPIIKTRVPKTPRALLIKDILISKKNKKGDCQ